MFFILVQYSGNKVKGIGPFFLENGAKNYLMNENWNPPEKEEGRLWQKRIDGVLVFASIEELKSAEDY